jgi:antitoxin component YwqK of YwqJK toxin-antitoxin module
MKTLVISITILVCLILFSSCSVTNHKISKNPKIGLIQTNYRSGKLKNETYTKTDTLGNWIYNGVSESYYKNGQLKAKGNFKDDKQDGLWKWYYDDGHLKSQVNYKDGEENGLSYFYYKNGKLKQKVNSKDDKPGAIPAGMLQGDRRQYQPVKNR